ncbi:MAG TPA: glycine betaine ABC transporter substrate-binding protein [Ktedonobacterales bacterium]|nr:glycine betaine ABC transporter substrate-binding protein [Ktedonobacterales bacterium]
MTFTRRYYRAFGALLLVALVAIAGCGTSASTSGKPGSGVKVTVGSKNDADSQLLGSMYALLLENAGYTVTQKIPLGQTPVLDAAIKSGAIDMYPEFTGTSLTVYKLPQTSDPQQAFQSVSSYYESNFKLTWLDAAYGLNDSYGICTSQANAPKYHLSSLDDLVAQSGKLVLATQDDGVAAAEQPVEKGYNITFKSVVKISEQLSFGAVTKGDADLNVCYTTDPNIVTNNFVVLKDTKNVFPVYNPAPVVRDALLSKSPAIKATLNPLASKLTTDEIVKLIKQVSVDHQQPLAVAKTWLQSQGLLPK